MNADVFVSYSHEDVGFASKFKNLLQTALGNSLTVWMDQEMPRGAYWRSEIDEALESASVVALVISPDSMKSSYVTGVLAWAPGGMR